MGQMGGGYYGQGHGIYSNQPYMNQNYQGAWHRLTQSRLPFLARLNLPNLARLMNDLVSHDSAWLVVPNKLPSDIPEFKGKAGEDPSEHVTNFHLWCSSNSLHDCWALELSIFPSLIDISFIHFIIIITHLSLHFPSICCNYT